MKLNTFRDLPSVDRLLSHLHDELEEFGRQAVVASAREALEGARASIRLGSPEAITVASLAAEIRSNLVVQQQPSLRPVLNLTGTLVHTNLGRAILPASAREAVARVASEACNLEYDLAAGRRGDRDTHIDELLVELTGAEAATVVNNNAAAVLLVLNSLALAREVPVSRGELIEIGDAFRIPDIMSRSGAELVEVGTTNRTHARDYENAITERTAALMQVHTSNYIVQGFTKSVPLAEMADIAHARGLPLICDLGSGTLVDLADYGLPRELTVREVVAAGADLVTFSGDKLLGGPQAGLIVGKREYLDVIRRNPLRRALRVDKLRLAALSDVLMLHRDPEHLAARLPTLRLMLRSMDDLKTIGSELEQALTTLLPAGLRVSLIESSAQPGSGSLPGQEIPSLAIAIQDTDGRDATARRLEEHFRGLSTPVIGRVQDSVFRLDLRNLESPEPLLALAHELSDSWTQTAPGPNPVESSGTQTTEPQT